MSTETPGQPDFQWQSSPRSGGDLVPQGETQPPQNVPPAPTPSISRRFNVPSLPGLFGDLAVVVGGLGTFIAGFFNWYRLGYPAAELCGNDNAFCLNDFVFVATAFNRGFARFSIIIFLVVAVVYLIRRPLFRGLVPDEYLDLGGGAAICIADLFFLISLLRIPDGTLREPAIWIAAIFVAAANVGIAMRVHSSGALSELPALAKGGNRSGNAPSNTRPRSSTPPPRTYAQGTQQPQPRQAPTPDNSPPSQPPPASYE